MLGEQRKAAAILRLAKPHLGYSRSPAVPEELGLALPVGAVRASQGTSGPFASPQELAGAIKQRRIVGDVLAAHVGSAEGEQASTSI